MPVLKDYECVSEDCSEFGRPVERFVAEDDTNICEKCRHPLKPLPVATKAYSISGDNSASTKPKKLK